MSIRLSKSKINLYQYCPRQYYLINYTDCGKARSKTLVTPQMENGSILHSYFELWNTIKDSEVERLYNIEETLMEDEFYRDNIKNFHQILNNLGLTKATFSEKRLYDKELDMSGIIDAIYTLPSGEKCLIDYKSGKFSKASMTAYRFELMIYVILAERNLNIKIDKIGMIFSSYPDATFIVPVKPGMYDKALIKYQKFYKLISDGVFPKAQYTRKCMVCGYNDICASTNVICDDDEEVVEVTV